MRKRWCDEQIVADTDLVKSYFLTEVVYLVPAMEFVCFASHWQERTGPPPLKLWFEVLCITAV